MGRSKGAFVMMVGLVLVLISQQAVADEDNTSLDKEIYREIATQSIELLQTDLDEESINALLKMQDRLILLAAVECIRFAELNPEHATLMNLAIDNNQTMKSLSLEEIEADWHQGGVAREHGIDWDGMPHFSPAVNAVEAVVHPATVYILLELYRDDGDAEHLMQAIDELNEVLQHLSS